MLKKITALFLAAVLALSAGCTKTDPTKDTGTPAPETTAPATEAPATEAPSTEAPTEPPVDKQAFYEELFRKKEVRYAGESMKIVTDAEEEGLLQEIRFETAGQDSMMLIRNELTGAGYGVYSVGKDRYLYGKLRDETGSYVEKLLVISDPDFDMGEEDKPDLDFDEAEGDYRIEYAGTTDDGLDEVLYYDPEEEGAISLFFNKDAKVERIGMESAEEEGAQPVSMVFYDVDRIALPENVTAEEAEPETLMTFLMMCLFSMVPEDAWQTEESSEAPETDPPVASVPSIEDMFLADRDLQIDYHDDGSVTYRFDKLPYDAQGIQNCMWTCGMLPENTAAFFIAAMHAYGQDPDQGDEMIRRLMDPDTTLTARQFITSQLVEKPYLCEVYFLGVDLKKVKTAEAPCTVKVTVAGAGDPGYTNVKVYSDAVGGERTITLKNIGEDYYVVRCPELLLSIGDLPY
ncbi:MAG: hypothetical protein J6Z38_03065 [Lachnospiraceae bacterium]|nr:hypothetical protein [Lachnospiraceae bacterium]